MSQPSVGKGIEHCKQQHGLKQCEILMTNNTQRVIHLFVDNKHWYLGSIFTWIKYLYSLILTEIKSLNVCGEENRL